MIISAISIIIPAAGRSERMGRPNKLLLPLCGRTLIEHVVETALQVGPLEVIVVTGHDRAEIKRAVGSFRVRCIHNPDFAEGMGSTIGAGIAAASPDASGYAILPADLPFLRPKTILDLAGALSENHIVAPRYEGERGHPVLFGRRFRNELLTLRGDEGGRSILEAHSAALTLVDIADPGTVQDIDTMEDYDGVRG